MTIDDLRAVARPGGEQDLPLLRIDSDEDAPGIVGWFGADRSRAAVRLVVQGEDAGYVERADLYDLMRSQTMGWGDAERSTLPGFSTQWRAIELFCPEPGCAESPLYAVTFDAGRPPRCRLHPERALGPR
jgi:hypothetical protein